MGVEIPDTQAECSGCGETLNLLEPYLQSNFRAKRDVLIVDEVESEDPNEVGTANIYLGTKSGRGVVLKFHDFDCQSVWVDARKGLKAKLEVHREEGEPYVPEDNGDEPVEQEDDA